MVRHSEAVLKEHAVDFFVYGHRHLVVEFELSTGAKYFNLGDWIGFLNGQFYKKIVDKSPNCHNILENE